MNLNDYDAEMPLKLIDPYIKKLVLEYESLLYKKIEDMQRNNATITIKKMKNLKKSVLFGLLRKENKK